DGLVEDFVRSIVIDDRDPLADRSRQQLFVLYVEGHLIADVWAEARVECISLERPNFWRLDVHRPAEFSFGPYLFWIGLCHCWLRCFGFNDPEGLRLHYLPLKWRQAL